MSTAGGGSKSPDEEEDNVLTELWTGFIPIQFTLALTDLASSRSPNQVFVFSSRYSYLSHVAEVAVEYFRSFAIDLKPSIWFEYNNIPLKR